MQAFFSASKTIASSCDCRIASGGGAGGSGGDGVGGGGGGAGLGDKIMTGYLSSSRKWVAPYAFGSDW